MVDHVEADGCENPSQNRAGGEARARRAFAVLLALHAALVWLVRYPPSCDGPAHLETAHALRHRLSATRSPYHDEYVVRRDPSASWFSALALAGLMSAVPPVAALKILMTGYVVLLPLALRYAITGIAPRRGDWSLAAFPLVFNKPFLYGFFGFAYGMALFLFVIGYWARTRSAERPPVWRLTVLGLLLHVAHPFALLATTLAIGVLGSFEALCARAPGVGLKVRLLASAWIPVHAFLPALVLVGVFVSARLEFRAAGGAAIAVPPAQASTRRIPVISYEAGPAETLLAFAFLAAAAAAVALTASDALRQRRWAREDAWFVLLALWAAAAALGPARVAQGTFLAERSLLYAILAAIFWCAARGRSLPVAGTAVLVAVPLLAVHFVQFRAQSRTVEDYVRVAACLETGSRLLPLHEPADAPVPFLQHAASYLAVARDGVNLGNYQPSTNHFPLILRGRLRSEVAETPDAIAALPFDAATRARLSAALAGGESAPDYVLVAPASAYPGLRALLARQYAAVCPSRSPHVAVLARRRTAF